MVNSRLKVYRVKEDKVILLKDWGQQISGPLLSEAMMSLDEENCYFEQASLFSIDSKLYVIGLMVSKPNANFVKGPQSNINKKHWEILSESLDEEIKIEDLYRICAKSLE